MGAKPVHSAVRDETSVKRQPLPAALLVLVLAYGPDAAGQRLSPPNPAESTVSPSAITTPFSAPSLQPLLDFKNSDIKFNLRSLMNVLRDNDHEGWVLAAYPDPKTSRPLIGAGFSLDVMATNHPQYDPLNTQTFLEPSSEQLWEAAGFEPERLQTILGEFNQNMQTWSLKTYRKRIRKHMLSPQLTEEEATRLLRISTIQAIHNARAYCRDFDRLTGPQQMALSQLVFQMGVNLEQFTQFLSALNGDTNYRDLSAPDNGALTENERWNAVQRTLIDSQWARRYRTRAATVIAMFDPKYAQSPDGAERRVAMILRPPVVKRKAKKHSVEKLETRTEGSKRRGKRGSGSQSKRKLT